MQKYKALIDEYKNNGLLKREEEKKYFEGMNDLKEAIKKAANATNKNGKKFSHQSRIPPVVLKEASDYLLNKEKDLENAKDFNEIYSIVKKTKIKRFGELCLYDTSLRIGFFRKIYPTKIHLHAGPLEAVKNMNLNKRGRKVMLKEEFPLEFRKLEPYQLENFLCNYKDKLN